MNFFVNDIKNNIGEVKGYINKIMCGNSGI